MIRTGLLTIIILCLLCPVLFAAEANQHKSLAQARIFYESGDYTQAYPLYFSLFQQDPANREINFYLGKSALGLGDYEAAVMSFERVLIIAPAADEVKIELAKAYLGLGAEETAIHYAEEALAAELPDNLRQEVEAFLKELTGRPR
ncbi:MAG: tetratricopeptide repeat protein [Desulfobulbaceae bacterium]|nr:tetratricopeptide repeat protein [Desulfobulbaceae bacterium]